jgi:hydroxyacylglutathione hydrolase
VIIDRIFTPGLAQVAYLVADESTGDVAVIDPRRDVDAYIEWADERGFRITAILETHIHADFVSGSHELAARSGAPVYASWESEQSSPHTPLADAESVPVGSLSLKALWTPGHTPEHLGFLLIDPAQGTQPVALFSGDVLFVGEVGRPDLLGADQLQELATKLYHTVMDRLFRLPDDLIVYPGHTAGSACGKKIGEAPYTTIRGERIGNYAFQARSRDSFVQMVLNGMPLAPTYYPVMKQVNKVGATPLADLPEPNALDPTQVVTAAEDGAVIIDARPFEQFGEGHIPGAVAAGLGSDFVGWMGWLAPFDRDIILVLPSDDRLDEAVTDLRRIGLDRIAGYLAGGMRSWSEDGRDTRTLPQISAQELAHRREVRPNMIVLDVRSDEEWRDEHIPNGIHLYAGKIAQGADPNLPKDSEIAIICGSGYRSSFVASLLMERGYRHLINVDGGMDDWNKRKLPITRG